MCIRDRALGLFNVLYLLLVGWWVAAVHYVLALVMLLLVLPWRHAASLFGCGTYFVWPFGKALHPGEQRADSSGLDRAGEVVAVCVGGPLLLAVHAVAGGLCWVLVLFIPMSEVHLGALRLLASRRPLSVHPIDHPAASKQRLSCPRALASWRLLRTRWPIGLSVLSAALLSGMLVVALLMVLLDSEQHAFVRDAGIKSGSSSYTAVLAIILGVALALLNHVLRFLSFHVLRLVPIPVGMLCALVGGLLVPLSVFWFILEYQLNNLAQEVFSFALITITILVPGVCMIVAHLSRSVGTVAHTGAVVHCVLLMVCVVGLFTPTVFYSIYGRMEMDCQGCILGTSAELSCSQCRYVRKDFADDLVYQDLVKPLGYCCALLMPLPYGLSLVYLVFTHASFFHDDQVPHEPSQQQHTEKEDAKQEPAETTSLHPEQPASHDSSPEEQLLVLGAGLCAGSVLVVLASNDFVAALKNAGWETEQGNMFLSASIVVAVMTFSLLKTALDFALHGKIGRCIAIANQSAIQHSMVVMPILMLFAVLLSDDSNISFSLVFPTLSFIGVLSSTVMLNYVTLTGRTKALTGLMMVVLFCLWLAMYAHVPSHQEYLQQTDVDKEAVDATGRDGQSET
eukprot:TRINITY_DN3756_c0_g1_i1.p1 TRINITY_DN3756_c0_g1~~TRINITY_DN3756_c0_g1_i1.p1  ORF type:complete len:624 (-),score=203.23 TRINITY_DN3756_c0_g1_i1:242-2113(-)